MADEAQNQETAQTVVPIKPGMEYGGGNPPGGGDDLRITRLEKLVEKIEGKLDGLTKEVSDLRVQSATLTERVAHLPSKEYIFRGIVGVVTLMVALTVFGPRVQSFFGTDKPAIVAPAQTTP